MTRFLIVFPLLFTLLLNAQDDHRFAPPSAKWNVCTLFGWYGGPIGYRHYYEPSTATSYVLGDTIIDSVAYQIISSRIHGQDKVFVRQDSNRRVYLLADFSWGRNPLPMADQLIYDFSLEKGDTLILPYEVWKYEPTSKTVIIDSTDSVIMGQIRKRMFVRQLLDWGEFPDTMIEGIGSINSHFLSPYFFEPIMSSEGFKVHLMEYSDTSGFHPFQNHCVGTFTSISNESAQESMRLYPNPAKGDIYISGISEKTTFSLMNSIGSKVLEAKLTPENSRISIEHLDAGVYFYSLSGQSISGKLLIE